MSVRMDVVVSCFFLFFFQLVLAKSIRSHLGLMLAFHGSPPSGDLYRRDIRAVWRGNPAPQGYLPEAGKERRWVGCSGWGSQTVSGNIP
jgi:hypothetical protein